MNALENLPSLKSYSRQVSSDTSPNPAARSFDAYASSSSAPLMQPTQSAMSRRTSSLTSPRETTSETAKRPPGFSTRNASRRTASLSADRLITQFEMTTSTEQSG